MSRVALLMLVACSFQAHNKWPTFFINFVEFMCCFTLMVNHQFPKLSSKQEMHTNLQYLDIFIQCLFFKSFLAMCLPQKFDECFFFLWFFFHMQLQVEKISLEIYAYTNTVFQSYQYIDHTTKRVDMHVAGASLFILSNEFVIFIKI